MSLPGRIHEALTNSTPASFGCASVGGIHIEETLAARSTPGSKDGDEDTHSSQCVDSSTSTTISRASSTESCGGSSQSSGKGDDSSRQSEEEDGEASLLALNGHKAQRKVSAPNRRISSFEIRFSQMRMRSEFRCGRSVEEAVASIKAVREDSDDGEIWRLEAPFPPIEVIPWRCKLRDQQGRPIVDEVTGGEVWDSQDRIFTLDNRRLYCLQKAAAELWPKNVVIDAVELPPQSLTSMRQVRKFRTPDSGNSISVGSRVDGETLVQWSWRAAVGLSAAEETMEAKEDCHVQARRRPRGEYRQMRRTGDGGARGFQHPRGEEGDEEDEGKAASGLRSRPFSAIILFLGVQLALSVTRAAVAHYTHKQPALEASLPLQAPSTEGVVPMEWMPAQDNDTSPFYTPLDAFQTKWAQKSGTDLQAISIVEKGVGKSLWVAGVAALLGGGAARFATLPSGGVS